MSLLRRKYLSSAVNVLRNSLKILHITKRNLVKLNCLGIHQELSEGCRHLDLNTVWVRLPSCLLKGTVKRRFLHIYLTTFFGVRNFGNTLDISVAFFKKTSKIYFKFRKCRKKLWKEFLHLNRLR